MIKDGKMTDTFRLRMTDFTCNDTFAPQAVLDLCQDVAGKHAMSFNMGFEDMIAKNLIWVLVSVKYEVINDIAPHSTVDVTTWPKQKGLVDFDRETLITSVGGDKEYIRCISKWVIINNETRMLIPAKRIEFSAYCPEDTLFNEKFVKLKDFDIEGFNKYTYQIEFNDLDHNGHVNNARYAYMMLNAIKPEKDENIKNFQIDFVHETYKGGSVDIYYKKEENTYLVKGISNNQTAFLCNFNIK